jgi:hypothetical protein
MILSFSGLRAALMALVAAQWEGLKLRTCPIAVGRQIFTLLVDQKLPLRPIQALFRFIVLENER